MQHHICYCSFPGSWNSSILTRSAATPEPTANPQQNQSLTTPITSSTTMGGAHWEQGGSWSFQM
ncbi:unknown protein (plasmid) [Synechocystis sp. PCC 6803]|uniref:Uncharacterized protein n=1 Tax=Synechocystis sp. (strain ATCC 27184 / PCC 6803 / Kazusa) TaxID=1111708 RepID=Q6ZE68_SYNY3|nr:hypothetical protein MYO_5250 [Synechocystis sp. PCC 6803]AVP91534.1 hypothetical protein C7I86_17320 [Synechocystis sp. IPPAS B-1465]MCW5242288.1 hypothetical protein [Synechocystis sp. PCC 6803]BAD02032.1 unknown protein [Synechocystis sp. PCC 6803]